MKVIKSHKEFLKWAEQNNYFEDASILKMMPFPSANQEQPPTISIDLAYQIKGNYKANSIRKSRAFRLTSTSVTEYHLDHSGSYEPGHCTECMEVLESADSIGFCIDTPARLTLRCKELCVEKLPDIIETVKPWISKRDFYAEISSKKMPSPKDWTTMFANHGHNVIWHIYGGPPVHETHVPESNYTGWFLQEAACLDFDHQGIFFFSCSPTKSGFRLQVINYETSKALWHTMKTIAGEFQDAEIHCGNCEFTNTEWLKFLSSKKDG